MPTVNKLNGHKFALLQHEEFIIGLACREDIPGGFSIICTPLVVKFILTDTYYFFKREYLSRLRIRQKLVCDLR